MLLMIFSSGEVVTFFIIVFISGFNTGIISNFTFIFVEQTLGASSLLLGVSRFITCASELPFFFFSGAIIERIGVRAILLLAMFTYALRLLYYAAMQAAWMLLPIGK